MNVDYVLIPSVKDIYKNKKKMKINISKKDKILCAKYRPGHFEGVLGVVFQYLSKIKAKYMFLGEKDYQQIYIIKKYLLKKFKTKIISCKTIRYKNTFPYSSRNKLLLNSDLKNCIKISKILNKFYFAIKKDFSKIKKINQIYNLFSNNNMKIEYLEIRNKNNLSKKFNKNNFKIFIAYYLNKIRLIDNY